MKIILKKDVHGLGYKDEVLTVKDGYGRNYLLPQGLAVLATEKAMLKQRLRSSKVFLSPSRLAFLKVATSTVL